MTARKTAAKVSPVVSEYANTVKVYASAAARGTSARLQPAIAEYAQTARNCASQATRAVLSLVRASPSPSQHLPGLEHVQSDWERPFSSPRRREEQHQDTTEEKRESDEMYITQEQICQVVGQDRIDYDPLGVSEEYHRRAEERYAEMRRKRLREHWERKKEKDSTG